MRLFPASLTRLDRLRLTVRIIVVILATEVVIFALR
jgi:hypothetical protein